jgi:16S rRNA processing protein RimM
MEIAVRRDQLPPATADEFYWTDLEGLRVETESGETLGLVHHLFSTGANDVLVVRGSRERLVPFLWGTVVDDVDFEQGLIRVRWDPDF